MHPKHLVVASLGALVASMPLVAAQTVPPQDPAEALRLDLAQCRVDREAGDRRIKQLEGQLRLTGDVEQLVRRMAAAEARVLELESEKAACFEQMRQLKAEVTRLQDAPRPRPRSSSSGSRPSSSGSSGPRWVPGPLLPWTNPTTLPPASPGQPVRVVPPFIPAGTPLPASGPSSQPSGGLPSDSAGSVVEQTRLVGRVRDLGRGTLLKVASGRIYEVTDSPQRLVDLNGSDVKVRSLAGSFLLSIDGLDKPIVATLVSRGSPWSVPGTPDRVESTIQGTFEGFAQGRLYRFANGDVWEQTEYRTLYHNRYAPEVTVTRDGSEHRMSVKGVTETVVVKRVK